LQLLVYLFTLPKILISFNMAKTPPKPTGNREQDLINLANAGSWQNKIKAIITIKQILIRDDTRKNRKN